LAASGCFASNARPMAALTGIRHVLFPKAFTNNLNWISKKPIIQLSNLSLFVLSYLLQFHMVGLSNKLMYVMPFYMDLLMKLCTWLNLLALFILNIAMMSVS
jgi:hypothetical protein